MIQLLKNKKMTQFIWISSKGLNFAFKDISPCWDLNSTRNGLNIFTNLNKTFSSDLLGGKTVGVYSQNEMHMPVAKFSIPDLMVIFR
jgi:hypothetical protein